MTFHYWLEQKFIDWIATERQRKTLTEFAKWIGISQSLMNRYMSGKVIPSEENVHKIAARLGPEVYDLLGLARPDPDVQRIVSKWHYLPPWLQKRILHDIERAEKGELPDESTAQSLP